ncbi:Hypothetical protein NocV09_01100360 [Nannochloropsis oceanica]
MRGVMSRRGAVTLLVMCLSWLPGPLHATRGATPAEVEPYHVTSGSSSAGSLSRLLDYDLPLPHDWIHNSQMDINALSFSYSYSYSFAKTPEPSETASRTTTSVVAATAQDTPRHPSQSGEIPIVTMVLLMAGSPEEQKEAIAAIVTYLKAHMQQWFGQNVEITTGAPNLINLRPRSLQSTSKGRLCTIDAPQDEIYIELRNFDDVAQVQDILTGIMTGTIVLTAGKEGGTSIAVKDSICRAETTLSFVPPPMETLHDTTDAKDMSKPLAPLHIALIVVVGVSVLFAAVFLARRYMVPRPRSAIVLSS